MSGHSKWATTKHQKGAKDKARSKLFAKLIRQVEVAAREGGGDINANATLRTMFQKARDASVPLDTIERAIKRGTGELEGVRYEAISYEGYAPSGVAVIVECLTDNRNRTGSEIRTIFSRNGGSMAEPGAVSWQFERKGIILIPNSVSEDDIVAFSIECGAENVELEQDSWVMTCNPSDLHKITDALDKNSIKYDSAEMAMVSANTVEVTEESVARKVLHVMDLLEEHDDVQNVWSNFLIPDEMMAAIAE